MSDLSELKKRIEKARQDLHQALPFIATKTTLTAKALIERNIREVGFGAHYSNNKLPAFFFFGKAKSKAGEAYIKMVADRDNKNATVIDGKKVYAEGSGMTWAELRQAEGLPTDHVDLSFTNKTWAGTLPLQPYFQGNIIKCPLGGTTVEVVDKLNWNRDRYGDFLGKSLGEKEIELLQQVVLDDVKSIFVNNGLSK